MNLAAHTILTALHLALLLTHWWRAADWCAARMAELSNTTA